MKPDLEVVQIGSAQSFKAWEHGYPFHTVRWHFHPECELHQVVATTGRYFVGDFIGDFAPGNLVLTGPNLPHNWVSDVAPGGSVPLRSRVLQFGEQFIHDATGLLPELSAFLPTLELSRRGVLFSADTAARVGPMIKELVSASEIRRIELFVSILGALSRDQDSRAMSSSAYHPDPSGFMATGINKSLDYVRNHLTESFGEKELAEISRLSTGAFSRSFRRHTGMPLNGYVNRLRINLAIQLLMSEEDLSITDICFASGFKNISNFNRQFLRQKGLSPSRFRGLLAENAGAIDFANVVEIAEIV
ncbi:bacterial regulatory helix-turn-helix s, AraC family protein [Collimonas fungivorans]|uniref:Bacterial regulatory helix-turn-helix s, AraC family protein n=1 Tax=Collimonas fungivorans TaxID=158899 RepID=A0A127PAS1_9BURK|nr:helix-turn-helix domain-containing protein [Collimonas fungivorans]AMO94906.1 bacterial regulatory helix-turn-helix s, AraC family protein [Collimonas fungivorans]